MNISKEEYDSLVSLAHFLIEQLPPDTNIESPALALILRLIEEYEAKNEKVSINELPCPFKVGDKSKAICYRCNKAGHGLVSTTFEEKGNENLLVGVCDECGAVISVPHQPGKDMTIAASLNKRKDEL